MVMIGSYVLGEVILDGDADLGEHFGDEWAAGGRAGDGARTDTLPSAVRE